MGAEHRLTSSRKGATRNGGALPGVPAPKPPDPPAWLSGDARAIWDALAPHVPAGRLTPLNADLFAMYVTTLATYREADSIITASGVLIAVGQDLAPNPALGIRNGADATAARWAKTFGLTPDSQPLAPPQAHEGPRRLPHLVEGA